ncbi:hypothetical protein, partial [Enterococcus faecalis]|uniref:hypothetical protein n=1 Tax=Enterococcus faecalis TaxID=1351 RepID=UPI000CF33C9F
YRRSSGVKNTVKRVRKKSKTIFFSLFFSIKQYDSAKMSSRAGKFSANRLPWKKIDKTKVK